MNLNYNKLIVSLIPFIIIITLALVLSRVFYINLPKQSVEHIESNSKNIKFNNYNYISSYGLNKIKQMPKQTIAKEYLLDQNIILQAIYLLSKNDGFAVIKERTNSKTQTLGKGDYFKEYKLVKIDAKFVVFEKQNKLYKLYMKNAKPDKTNNIKQIEQFEQIKPQVIDKGDNNYSVPKDDLKSYSKNLKKIWNNIGLRTAKKDGKIIGFKIYKLNQKSVFADLGLKHNDILTKVNNIELNNYQNAFKIYKLVDKMDLMQLTILRDNKEMEITYEIE